MKKVSIILIFLFSTLHVISQDVETSNNTTKRYFYRDSVISLEKWYGNDKKIDSLKTYYPTGTINEVFNFNNGKYQGNSFKYNRFGEKLTTWKFDDGKLIERIDHLIDFNKKDEEKIKGLHLKLISLNDSIKNNPNNIKWRYQRAHIRHQLNNLTLALNDFNKILKSLHRTSKKLKKKPPGKLLGNIYDSKGAIYSSLEMQHYASQYRYKATKADPENNRLKYNLGAYLYTIKSYRLSQFYLNEVLKEWKNHAFTHRLLAAMYTDFKDYEKAMYHINIAFPKEKNLIKYGAGKNEHDIRTIRGFLHHKLGNSEQGIADLKEAINLNKDNSFAYRNLGVVNYDLGNYDIACEQLRTAQDLGYEEIHDRYDLQEYLDASCQKANDIENKLSANSEPIETTNIKDKPFVYPNPGKDIVRIKNLSFEGFTYEIYDFASKLVSRNTSINGSVIVSNLSQGVYILKVISDTGLVETFRLIKD